MLFFIDTTELLLSFTKLGFKNIKKQNNNMKHSKSIIIFLFLLSPFLGIAQVMPMSFFQNKQATSVAGDGLTAATAGLSGLQLRTDYPSYSSGWYWIKSSSMPNALQMYVDMVEDGGGYDFYIITAGPSVSTVTETNGGTPLGLDLVMPRSKEHWKAMSKTVLQAIIENKAGGGNYQSFFNTVYGVYRTTSAGNGSANYTGKIMRSNSYDGSNNAKDWRVKDEGRWWLRDNTFSEPNGDYRLNSLLGGYGFPNPYNGTDLLFNDANSGYSTGRFYLVSTNAKQ
jgi:hypothetical protein